MVSIGWTDATTVSVPPAASKAWAVPWVVVVCMVALFGLGLSGIERADALSDGPDLAFDPGWLVGATAAESAGTWAAQERVRILDALRAAGGQVYGPGGAAHRLGLKPTTLYGKMRKHAITKSDRRWATS